MARTFDRKIKLLLALAVLLALGSAVTWWLQRQAAAEEVAAELAATAVPPVEYLELSPSFIVNFPYQGRQRFLQASVVVMSRDPLGIAAVTEHMPVIRHHLINLFSAQMLDVAESPESGIEALRLLATKEIQEILNNEIGRPGIDEVLFIEFVMQ